jgi:hypothetical protein
VSLVQGIIDTANVPRITSLVRSITVPSALANPYSGSGWLISLDAGIPAYGIKWSLDGAPASAGRRNRAVVTYEVPYLNLALAYRLADATIFVGDSVLTGLNEGWILFEHGQPEQIAYNISDGWSVDFSWLIAP